MMEIDESFIAMLIMLTLAGAIFLYLVGREPTYDKNCPPAKECVCQKAQSKIMTWTKINAQRVCGDYSIAKNACSASNMQFALFDRHGKIVKQFERYDAAIRFHDEFKNDESTIIAQAESL